MNDPHDDHSAKGISGTLWTGAMPRRTRRFLQGFTAARRSEAVIAREFGLSPHEAESAIDIARKEVAL